MLAISKKNESGREYGMHRRNKKCKQKFTWEAEYPVYFCRSHIIRMSV